MSSILLEPLANTNEQTNSNKQLNSVYNSNISDSLKIIEQNQAMQRHNKPEFLNQFDDLTFDNISEPVSINQSYTTINGTNTSLQRNLDFKNNYSNFQNSDMHYDVVSHDNFFHNNMTPNTSRRDFSTKFIHDDRSQRKLQAFTGIDPNYVAKKEHVPLFEPMTDLTWVNSMPVVVDKLTNRYISSNKNNNGNLPFENNVKVKHTGARYSVHRINPKNVDNLRSDTNQKITFENKPLETIKKGEKRAPDPTLSKYKLPDFKQNNTRIAVYGNSTIKAAEDAGLKVQIKAPTQNTPSMTMAIEQYVMKVNKT